MAKDEKKRERNEEKQEQDEEKGVKDKGKKMVRIQLKKKNL